MCICFTIFRQPFQGDDVNEGFIDLATAYFNARFAIHTAEKALRGSLCQPHAVSKKVPT